MEGRVMRDRIIDYIRRNRVSTTQVADCLGKSGALAGCIPTSRGHFKVGVVRWVYAYAESNWTLHERLTEVLPREVVFMQGIDCAGRAIAGELISKYVLLYRQAEAIISDAPFRDAGALLRENWPIWCAGFTPVGCFNDDRGRPSPQLLADRRAAYDGAIAVCDDGGVVLVPRAEHTERFLQRLEAEEEREDIWFSRLDRHKESTFDIVCLRTYEQSRPLVTVAVARERPGSATEQHGLEHS